MKLVNISKQYNEKKILSDLSLDFNKNGIIFILGKSGAGKTTLFNILNGVDNDYSGHILYDNINAANKKIISEYRKKIFSTIYQDINLIDSLNVKENILLGCKIGKKNCKDYYNILNKLDILELENREVSSLSGGERQRVAIARSLLRNDRIIYADEPTGNLDEENAKKFFKYIKMLSCDRIFIIVTHDRDMAYEFGDRIITLKNGTILSDEDFGYNNNDNFVMEDLDKKKAIKEKEKHHWKLKYCKKSLKKRKFKMIGVLFSILIAVLGGVLISSFAKATNNMYKEIDTSILENDKYKVADNSECLGYNTIDNDLYKELEKNNSVEYIEKCYSFSVNLIYDSVTIEQITPEVISDNEFYKKRFLDIEGDIPANSNEIMIDSKLAKKIFGTTDCIGKKVKVEFSGSLLEKDFIISAIKEYTSSSEGKLYISKAFEDEIYNNDICGLSDFINTENCELCATKYKRFDSLLAGRNAVKYNEIVISKGVINDVLNILSSDRYYSEEEIITKSDEILEFFKHNPVDIQTGAGMLNLRKFTIVGIADGEEKYHQFSDEFINSGLNSNMFYVYSNDISDKNVTQLKKISEKYGCTLENSSELTSIFISSKISGIIFIVLIITIIVLLMSIIMIHFFLKISIMERQYEIGVLLALGCKKREIREVLLIEQFILGILVSSIASIIILGAKISGIEKYTCINNVNVCCIEWRTVGLMWLITCFSIIIFSLPDIFIYSSKKINKLLKER